VRRVASPELDMLPRRYPEGTGRDHWPDFAFL